MDKNNIYIGNRYVPVFADPVEWNNLRQYEPLTIVTYQGTSYTSKKTVPVGIELNNKEYWVVTGNYNAQIDAIMHQISVINTDIENIMKLNTYVTPEMFGAKGDGVTNDTAAIQSAINSKQPVLFSSKTYVCGTVTVPNGTTLFSLSGLQEYGAGATIKLTSNFINTARTDNYVDALFMFGLRFVGNLNSNITMLNSNVYFRWSNIFYCSFINFNACFVSTQILGIRMSFCNVNDTKQFLNISCSDCFFNYIYASVYKSTTKAYDSFIDIHASTSVFESLYLTGVNGCTDNLFTLRGNGKNISIINSTFDLAKNIGLYIKPLTNEQKSSNIVISGNTFRSNGYAKSDLSADISIFSNYTFITENKFSTFPNYESGNYNIIVENAQYSIIKDNVLNRNKINVGTTYLTMIQTLDIDQPALTLTTNVTYYNAYYNCVISLDGYVASAKSAGSSTNLGTLNKGYIPIKTTYFPIDDNFYLKINTNGVVQLFYKKTTTGNTTIYTSAIYNGF